MKKRKQPIFVLADFTFSSRAVLEELRQTRLDAARWSDWDSEPGPVDGKGSASTFASFVQHERKVNKNPLAVEYADTKLGLRGAIHPGGYLSAGAVAVFAREAAARGGRGRALIVDAQTARGYELAAKDGDAPVVRLSSDAVSALLDSPEIAEIAAWVEQKQLPESMEPPGQERARPAFVVPGAAREMGLQDFSQVALGSGNPEDAAEIRRDLPDEVAGAEDAAIQLLLRVGAGKLLPIVRALPATVMLYRKDGRQGEPLGASEAFQDEAELREALASSRTVHPVWGRSLPGLAFAMLGDVSNAKAEGLARAAFFSEAPVHYRARSAWALRTVRDDDVLDAFLEVLLSSKSEQLRDSVSAALGASSHPRAGERAFAGLRELLTKKTKDAESRVASLAFVLGDLHFVPAVKVLIGLLKRSRETFDEAVGRALIELGDREGLETVAKYWQNTRLEGEPHEVGAEALVALGLDTALERARPVLAKNFAKNDNAYYCAMAVLDAASARFAHPDAPAVPADLRQAWVGAALELLCTLAQDEALGLLSAIRAPGTAEALVERLAELDADSAAETLLQLGDRSVVPLLREKISAMNKRAAKPYLKVLEQLSKTAN